MKNSADYSLSRHGAAIFIGNALEFYDFSLFGFSAPLLTKVFFGELTHTAAMLSSLGTFAIAFLTRPLGGLLLGSVGDKLGRKEALSLSILLMAFSTALIGCLPSYSMIGIFSPLLLMLLRVFQGLGAGGEYPGASLFLIEHFNNNHKGFAGALVIASCALGVLVASLSMFVCLSLSSTWGWRIAYLLGGAAGIVGFYIRRNLCETPLFLEAQYNKERVCLSHILKNRKNALLRSFGLSIFANILINITVVYTGIYLSEQGLIPYKKTLPITAWGLLMMAISALLFAKLADRIGLKKVMRAAAISCFISAIPVFLGFNSGYDLSVYVGISVLGALTGTFAGLSNAFISTLFPVQERYRGMALGYNMGLALFGGTTPILCYYLIGITNNYLMPAFYLMGASLIGLLCLEAPSNQE